MKELYKTLKNDSQLHERQLEHLEFDNVFEKIDHTWTTFGAQYLYFLITQTIEKLSSPRQLSGPRTMEALRTFDRYRHQRFVLYLMGSSDPFAILRAWNINLYRLLAGSNILFLILSFWNPLLLIPFVTLSFINSILYYSRKLHFMYCKDTILCAHDVDRFLKIAHAENEEIKCLEEFSTFYSNGVFREINPWLGEIAAFLFLFEMIKSIFLIDLFFIYQAYLNVENSLPELRQGYYIIAEIDARQAVSTLEEQTGRFEVHSSAEGWLKIRGMRHPLVNDCLPVDIDCAGGMVVTGHNASGKSTMIKSIILNYLVGNATGRCFCDSFTTSCLHIGFLIGSSDDLRHMQSLYQFEILELEHITSQATDLPGPQLFLMDEIIRGTNPDDRKAVSFAMAGYLSDHGHCVIMSTHMVSLAEDLEAAGFMAIFFPTGYDQLSGSFYATYKISPGIERTRNALQLLSSCKFPESFLNYLK